MSFSTTQFFLIKFFLLGWAFIRWFRQSVC
jgi:hypothetical protein